MRVCIVGAGAIGGLVGARLAAAGTPVSVLARGANLAAIRAAGLRLAEPDRPGVIRLVEGDRFPVGELDGERSERATRIAQLLTDAGFTSRVLTDIRTHLWVKAWGNLAMNPISALTGATLAEICRTPQTRALAAQMMAESTAVAEKLGLRLRVSIEQRLEG